MDADVHKIQHVSPSRFRQSYPIISQTNNENNKYTGKKDWGFEEGYLDSWVIKVATAKLLDSVTNFPFEDTLGALEELI
jgi:hypothetical protein